MKYLGELFLIIAALTFSPQYGTADIAPVDYSPLPIGGGVTPKSSHPTIRLDNQEVIIRLKESVYTVDAVFHLYNTGETSTEWIGFPKNTTGGSPGPRGRVMDFVRFDVSVNGEKLPFAEEHEFIKSVRNPLRGWKQPSAWLVGQATFPGHSVSTIRVSYEAGYDYSLYGKVYIAEYIYGTGSYWKDNIGKATFIIDSSRRGGAHQTMADFSSHERKKCVIHRRLISENVTRYEIRDFEPDSEGRLTIFPPKGR